jgi:two-component system sensor histidine kinase EvgS
MFSGKVALIIDDYPACRDIVSQQLKHFGFLCLQADNAQDAIYIARQKSIDLVLTDEFMPDMTGRQLAVHLLALQPDMKIIILTGDTLFANKLSSTDHQLMSDYLIKPVQLQELLGSLKKVLSEDVTRWDFHRLLDLSHQDESSAYTILESVLKTQEELLKDLLTQSLHKIDPQTQHISHKILGGARLINASQLIQYCLMIENTDHRHDAYLIDLLCKELKILNEEIKLFLTTTQISAS